MTSVMVSPVSCLTAFVISSLVSSTATDLSTGTSQASIVAWTWLRALPGAVGAAGRETRRFCSTAGRSGFCGAAGLCGIVEFCSAVGRVGWCRAVGRIGAMVSICFLTRLVEPVERALVTLSGQPPGRDHNLLRHLIS